MKVRSILMAVNNHSLVGDLSVLFFFQAEDGIRDYKVTGVQTCALPILSMAVFLLAYSLNCRAEASSSCFTDCKRCSMKMRSRRAAEVLSSATSRSNSDRKSVV